MEKFKNKSQIVLRVGLGITFLWIGYLIMQNPEGWGQSIQPWAQALLPFSLKATMIGTAIFDMIVGILLMIGFRTWIVAGLGALHLLSIIVTMGFNPFTIRDIGLLAAALSLSLRNWPEKN